MTKPNASPRVPLANAVELLLRKDVETPVITDYELGRIVYRVIADGVVEGRELRLSRRTPTRGDFLTVRRALVNRGALTEDRGLPHAVLRTGTQARPDPETIFCAIDPFSYASHLSAMVYHGLTNRLPKLLFFTSPASTQWRELALARMQRDLGPELSSYRAANLPGLARHKVGKIQGLTLNITQTKDFGGGFRIAQDGLLRVSTLGRTYLDMLRRSDLCGGMAHVIEIFEQNAKEHLSLIIGEVDKHGTQIDHVRAGYILEDRCGLSDRRIDAWVTDAQRGGSRRLDPEKEYMPTFSERWMISVNV